MKIAFDMSSIMWTALLAGKDKEGHEVDFEDRKQWVNHAPYGYENAVNMIVSAMKSHNLTPINAILVVEGMNSKAPRLMIDRSYKSKRGKRPTDSYLEFEKLRELLTSTFKKLGALVLTQDNVEGDDTLAWVARGIKEDLVIVTNDNDMAALEGHNEHGARIIVRIDGQESVNKYGAFPAKYITLYKAMVGDTNDSIPGIKGFGPTAWLEFDTEFGETGMAEMVRLCELGSLEELGPDSEVNKMAKRIYDARADVLRCYKLAKLHPEWCDTMNNPIRWEPGLVMGEVTDERLRQWRQQQRLVTAATWDAFRPWALALIENSPFVALDIETSSADESDDWLAAQGDPEGVDTMGSSLTGMSLTFGPSMQYTVYIPVDHKDTDNVAKPLVQNLIEDIQTRGKELVIHNTMFEGPVMFNEFGAAWMENGYQGFLPNWLDTKIEASYVDENDSLGLKKLSKRWFGYDQVDYKTVTTIDGVQYKMNQLPATHVLNYACDDTITTSCFHTFAKFFMEMEGTYEVYKQVEIASSYLHAQSYVDGFDVSLPKIAELDKEDTATAAEAWITVRDYLMEQGWKGTRTPVYKELTPADIKEAHLIVTGNELKTQVRTISKIIDMIEHGQLAECVREAAKGDFTALNGLVSAHFKGEPEFNAGSSPQMKELMYDHMQLEVKIRNKPTPAMKLRGERMGEPTTNELAIQYALISMTKDDPRYRCLQALRLMKMVQTRKGLYYSKYPYLVHWRTGRVHASHNQCATNTRRASVSKPNTQQLSKHEKVEGYSPKVREMIIPHHKNAVIVSLDFMSQELRVIADYSKDENMLSCFIGANLKDMHSLTGVGIWNKKHDVLTYDEYVAKLSNPEDSLFKPLKKSRADGKGTNFLTEYGGQAPKLAAKLMVSESDAQAFIDAREAAFPQTIEWKKQVVKDARLEGQVTTKMGAVRHLRDAFMSLDSYIASKAERQAVNMKIQGSSAEMTKLAEGRFWQAELRKLYDIRYIGPVHDELVVSCAISDLVEFLPAMHACMSVQYADMVVPCLSSTSFGPDFGRQIEVDAKGKEGATPTKELIEIALSKLEAMKTKVRALSEEELDTAEIGL